MIVQVVPRLRLSALYVVNAVTPDVPRGSALMCSSDVIPWAALIVSACPKPSRSRFVSLSQRRRHSRSATRPSFVRSRRPSSVRPSTSTDVAIVADVARPPIDRAPGAPKETHPLNGSDRQIVGPSVLVDGPVDDLIADDFATVLQPLADCAADFGDVVVGRRTDRDPILRAARPEDVPPRDVEIGDAADNLVAVAADQHSVAVLPLHR